MYTVTDGNNKCVIRGEYPPGTVFDVPFYNNFGDNYAVLAFADGYEQAGLVEQEPDAEPPSATRGPANATSLSTAIAPSPEIV